jgi:thiosulfate/3-mercaptopyruvate sulfurtransferase
LGILIRTEDILKVTDAVVVDVREPESFLQGHIPGAVNLPLRSLSETREEVQNLLRPIDQLLPLLAERGIMPEKQVVVYGENAKAADVSGAARMFWVLEYLSFPRVHVLDGGWKKWVGEGRAIDTGPGVATPVPVESVKIKLRPNVIARQEDVLELVRRKSGVLVDSRPASYYSGAEKAEYVLRPGHIPTAENRPAISMLQGDALTFKTPEEISGAMQVGEQTTGRKIITYCNEGNSASLAYLGYRLLGCENVSMYDGSMAEWSRNPALAVEAEIPTAQPPTALTSAPIPVSSATPETVPPTPDPVTTPTNPTPPTVQPVP